MFISFLLIFTLFSEYILKIFQNFSEQLQPSQVDETVPLKALHNISLNNDAD